MNSSQHSTDVEDESTQTEDTSETIADNTPLSVEEGIDKIIEANIEENLEENVEEVESDELDENEF